MVGVEISDAQFSKFCLGKTKLAPSTLKELHKRQDLIHSASGNGQPISSKHETQGQLPSIVIQQVFARLDELERRLDISDKDGAFRFDRLEKQVLGDSVPFKTSEGITDDTNR